MFVIGHSQLYKNQCRVAIAKAINNSNVINNENVISGKSERLTKKGKETENRKSTTKEIISKPLYMCHYPSPHHNRYH